MEIVLIFKEENKELVREALLQAMKETNETLKLNVEINISIDFGYNYAEVH
jgi:hypothetical protein